MQIKNITLQNFRSFDKKEIIFDHKLTIIVGKNAAGKTNILEAVNLLATGKSFRATTEGEVVREGADLARVRGKVIVDGNIDELEIMVTRGEINGEKVPRKKLMINGASRTFNKFVGTFRTVLFCPEDMDLVSGSPSGRRRFLDSVCCQVDLEYRRSLLSYEKGIRQRNRLLQRIRDGEARREQLLFWNQLVIKNGEYLTKVREEFIGFANLSQQLDPSTDSGQVLSIEYDHSYISPARLEEYKDAEIASGTTLVGPHRDDFVISTKNTEQRTKEGKNLAKYGSRGEQRMGVLWIKLAELTFIDGKTGSRPVLLLDDIFSELDHKHREIIMNVIDQQQTIITTADPHTLEDLPAKNRKGSNMGTRIELGFDPVQ